ncbi:MAG: hypothetical protein QNK04_17510 [Myxococcota bacterium]|nr:hypothetical protein [Myxococcota bacterium]
MPSRSPGLVDIVREFLAVDLAVTGLLARYRATKLRFEEVQALVSDSEESALFRLKERCHALFRQGAGLDRSVRPREVLFDLAVGSLFHEAMKFRENFYQREVYGPRVRALRDEAGEEAESLFQEFEKIQAGVSERLDEGVHETRALLERTREQLVVLLADAGDGQVARYLIERRELVEKVFPDGLEALLSRLHGDAASGLAIAGRSYLRSGYYAEAEAALVAAVECGGDGDALEPSISYARGMGAYLESNYGESVSELARWAEHAGKPDTELLDLATAAVAKVEDLVQGEGKTATVAAARSLLEIMTDLRRSTVPV